MNRILLGISSLGLAGGISMMQLSSVTLVKEQIISGVNGVLKAGEIELERGSTCGIDTVHGHGNLICLGANEKTVRIFPLSGIGKNGVSLNISNMQTNEGILDKKSGCMRMVEDGIMFTDGCADRPEMKSSS